MGFSNRDLFFFLAYIFILNFPFLPGLEGWGSWAQDSFKMFTSCVCRMRGRGLTILSGPTPMEQEVEVEVDGGLLMVSRPSAASPVVWASPAFLFRLVLSLALLVFPCPAVAARVSSSLSTTHHVHHFHNKHGTVPIAINRMPFLTRGGHGKIILFLLLITALSTLLKTISQMLTSDFAEPSQKVHFYTLRNFSSRGWITFVMSSKLRKQTRTGYWFIPLLIPVIWGKMSGTKSGLPVSLLQLPIGQWVNSCPWVGG